MLDKQTAQCNVKFSFNGRKQVYNNVQKKAGSQFEIQTGNEVQKGQGKSE